VAAFKKPCVKRVRTQDLIKEAAGEDGHEHKEGSGCCGGSH
jgi:hypothetical protein